MTLSEVLGRTVPQALLFRSGRGVSISSWRRACEIPAVLGLGQVLGLPKKKRGGEGQGSVHGKLMSGESRLTDFIGNELLVS